MSGCILDLNQYSDSEMQRGTQTTYSEQWGWKRSDRRKILENYLLGILFPEYINRQGEDAENRKKNIALFFFAPHFFSHFRQYLSLQVNKKSTLFKIS